MWRSYEPEAARHYGSGRIRISPRLYLLAADEDFAPFRSRVTVADGAEFNAAEATDTMSFIADLPGVFMTRADALSGIFGNDTDPAVGTEGSDVTISPRFDGWGYAHLYRNEDGKMRRIYSFAIRRYGSL